METWLRVCIIYLDLDSCTFSSSGAGKVWIRVVWRACIDFLGLFFADVMGQAVEESSTETLSPGY